MRVRRERSAKEQMQINEWKREEKRNDATAESFRNQMPQAII